MIEDTAKALYYQYCRGRGWGNDEWEKEAGLVQDKYREEAHQLQNLLTPEGDAEGLLSPEETTKLAYTDSGKLYPNAFYRIKKAQRDLTRRERPKFNNVLEADAHNWDIRELERLPDREKIEGILIKVATEPLASKPNGIQDELDQILDIFKGEK